MYWGSWLSVCVIPLTYCFFDLKSAVIITNKRFKCRNFTITETSVPCKNFVSIASPEHNSLFQLKNSLYSGCAAIIKLHFLLIIRHLSVCLLSNVTLGVIEGPGHCSHRDCCVLETAMAFCQSLFESGTCVFNCVYISIAFCALVFAFWRFGVLVFRRFSVSRFERFAFCAFWVVRFGVLQDACLALGVHLFAL